MCQRWRLWHECQPLRNYDNFNIWNYVSWLAYLCIPAPPPSITLLSKGLANLVYCTGPRRVWTSRTGLKASGDLQVLLRWLATDRWKLTDSTTSRTDVILFEVWLYITCPPSIKGGMSLEMTVKTSLRTTRELWVDQVSDRTRRGWPSVVSLHFPHSASPECTNVSEVTSQ